MLFTRTLRLLVLRFLPTPNYFLTFPSPVRPCHPLPSFPVLQNLKSFLQKGLLFAVLSTLNSLIPDPQILFVILQIDLSSFALSQRPFMTTVSLSLISLLNSFIAPVILLNFLLYYCFSNIPPPATSQSKFLEDRERDHVCLVYHWIPSAQNNA